MIWFIIIGSGIVILIAALLLAIYIFPPGEEWTELYDATPVRTSGKSMRIGNSWTRQSECGLYELYVEGKPYERGLVIGKLTRDLIYRQEKIFIREVKKIVPSRIYLFVLKTFVAAMNRRLNRYIGDEYCREIHGVSLSASPEFSSIGPAYQRYLNYHAAHDIGHILKNRNLVGCTSFSAWGSRTEDGSIITGRNFDFYVGDEFSREKIVCFYAPEQGHRFATISWGGMIGTVSGMNMQGLAVTVNGAKAELPNRSATPISILVREILQYASDIEEAFRIAGKKSIFVSESLMISSARDRCTVIIEKSHNQTVLYRSEKDHFICTNHFQSKELASDKLNEKHMKESPTVHRYERVSELLGRHPVLGAAEVAAVLRNKKGLHDEDMGMGNEIAIDQLLAHHSVIFRPEQRIMWICSGPYPEGIYQAYDLNKIFASGAGTDETKEICERSMELKADPFLGSADHDRYIIYKELLSAFREKKNTNFDLSDRVEEFIASNPAMFAVYSALGDYFLQRKDHAKAAKYFEEGLTKHLPNKHEKDHMIKGLDKARRGIEH